MGLPSMKIGLNILRYVLGFRIQIHNLVVIGSNPHHSIKG